MSQFGKLISNHGPGGYIQTLTGDVGPAQFPNFGNINIFGANGIETEGSAGLSTLLVKNLRDVSEYVVAPIPGDAGYSSIQAAINQAVADGYNNTDPVTVWIWDGTYVEDLTLYAGINLMGTSPTQGACLVQGTATLNSPTAGAYFSASNIAFEAVGATTSLVIAGTNTGTYTFRNCLFSSSTAAAISCTNPNATITWDSCIIFSTTGAPLTITDASLMLLRDSSLASLSASTIGGGAQVSLVGCTSIGSYTISGTATLEVYYSTLTEVGGAEVFSIGGAARLVIYSCAISCTAASTYWANGTGTIQFNDISAIQSADSVSPTLTSIYSPLLVGNLSFDGGTSQLTTNGELIIGNSLGQPQINPLTAGAGITITNGPGTITISATGSDILNYTNVNTSPYVVQTTDEYLSVDCSIIPITIQLPDAATTGQVFYIKDRTGSANTNNITVTTVSGLVNIDGATTYTMNTQYSSINVIGNSASYEIF